MKLVLATNNPHKVEEIKSILSDLEVEILTPQDFDNFPELKEEGSTLEENAISKAMVTCQFTGLPSLADDTGLEVEALDGAPGVRSARFAGETATYDDNNRRLLSLLEGLPKQKRNAVFRCVIAIAFAEQDVQTAEGRAEGYIIEKPRGKQGFGYDPLFYYSPLGKTFAELSPHEKNRVSHRAKALARAKELIVHKLSEGESNRRI
ncbi:MAG: XTP/dITP diphosphatase [Candidatus Zixiibacteriota bacterium]